MMKDVDVVVVGAGPVGLLLAVELALGGARPLVLERLAAPNTGIKALGVGPLGAEALQRRGLADALAAEEERNLAGLDRSWRDGGAGPPARFVGHFAFLFIREDARGEPDRRMRAVHQQGLEAMLADRARALGIEVRRGCAVTGFSAAPGGLDVDYAAPDGAGRVRCAFLVGCDGGRSAVRKAAGFAFPGTPPTMTMYQAVAEVDDPAGALPPGWHRTPSGVFARGPFPRRLFMLDFAGPPADRDAPVTRDEVEAVLRRVSGADVRVGAMEQANRWADNTRLADTYRRGRVFLAGDAAHVHAPFGGQGLSLGLGDAANLGWKMAAALRGDRPDARSEALLDSYTAERRPVAEAVLANTLAQAALLRPDPQSGALRDVLAGLLELPDVNRRFGDAMRGLSHRYDLGQGGDPARGDVGRSVGDRPVGPGGATLYALMQDGSGVLVDASGGGGSGSEGEIAALAAGVPGLRRVAAADGPSMLVRPDGCVAWAGEAGDAGRPCAEGLEAALGRWFAPAAASEGEASTRSCAGAARGRAA